MRDIDLAKWTVDRPFLLTEGSVTERLRRDPSVRLDPHILHAGFVYEDRLARALAQVYHEYLGIGRMYDLPMVAFAPTWRASPERLARAGFDSVDRVNHDGVRFLCAVIQEYGVYAERVLVGAVMGCAGDAYSPREALSAARARWFHRSQARALVDAGADIVVAATLPAISEALGMAGALAEFTARYAISFVVRPSGTLLDGTPLCQAVQQIDRLVHPQPQFYMANCVHPSVFEQAMERAMRSWPDLNRRVIGLQANTSARSPEELDSLDHLEGADPEDFADHMVRLYDQLGTRVLGGCCGTDVRHIAAIAQRMVGTLRSAP